MKRVLLTGASGFIGRHAIAPLLSAGYEVHAVARHAPDKADDRVRWHQADLLKPGTARALVESVRPTHALHFAWYAEPGLYWTAPQNLHWVSASLELLEAAADAGASRVVGAGSSAEYDWHSGTCTEFSTPLRPATLYGTAKHALHLLAETFLRERGVSHAWGRVFFLFGPGEHRRRLVSSVIRNLLASQPAPVSRGDQVRDFLHVQDVADAFVALLDSSVEGPVNIASGRPVAVREVISVIGRQLGGEALIRWGALPMPVGEPEELRADVKRLKDEVGWAPRYSLETGIAHAIEGWRASMEND